jgi:uncharacterized protein
MDITPLIPEGRQVIQAYGEGRFRIAGESYEGSVLIAPRRSQLWPIASIEQITLESLRPLLESDQPLPEILLVGAGKQGGFAPFALRKSLKEKGVAVEWMDTGAACRTFNVLLSEERRVAAALIAVP